MRDHFDLARKDAGGVKLVENREHLVWIGEDGLNGVLRHKEDPF